MIFSNANFVLKFQVKCETMHSLSSSMMAILAVLMPMVMTVTAEPVPEVEIPTSNSSVSSLMASSMISTLRSYCVVLGWMTISPEDAVKSSTSVCVK